MVKSGGFFVQAGLMIVLLFLCRDGLSYRTHSRIATIYGRIDEIKMEMVRRVEDLRRMEKSARLIDNEIKSVKAEYERERRKHGVLLRNFRKTVIRVSEINRRGLISLLVSGDFLSVMESLDFHLSILGEKSHEVVKSRKAIEDLKVRLDQKVKEKKQIMEVTSALKQRIDYLHKFYNKLLQYEKNL